MHSAFTVSEDAGIEPRTFAMFALTLTRKVSVVYSIDYIRVSVLSYDLGTVHTGSRKNERGEPTRTGPKQCIRQHRILYILVYTIYSLYALTATLDLTYIL